MSQLHIPPATRALADTATAEARRIQTSVSGGFSTEAGLDMMEAAALRLKDAAQELRLHIRQIRATEAKARRERTVAEARSA